MAVFGLLQNSRRLKCKRITTMRLCSPSSSLLVVVGNGLRHWSNAWCYGGRHLEVIGFAVARLVGNRGCVLGLVLVLVFFFFLLFFFIVSGFRKIIIFCMYVSMVGGAAGGGRMGKQCKHDLDVVKIKGCFIFLFFFNTTGGGTKFCSVWQFTVRFQISSFVGIVF